MEHKHRRGIWVPKGWGGRYCFLHKSFVHFILIFMKAIHIPNLDRESLSPDCDHSRLSSDSFGCYHQISKYYNMGHACCHWAVSGSLRPHVPLPMEFSRQKYWSRLPFPPPGDLPGPGMEPASPRSPALAGRFFTTELREKPK